MESKETISNLYPLKGKRIIITAIDLESDVHRGIANYTKNLIQSLKSLGADVWLLTGFSSDINIINKYNIEKKKIEIARILGQFSDPDFRINDANIYSLRNIYTQGGKSVKIIYLIKFFLITLLSFFSAYRIKYKIYERKYFEDNPLLKTSRLDYFENIDGIISAKNIYEKAKISSLFNFHPLKIHSKKFDVFITNCPVFIKASNNIKMIQTIHDLIPLVIPLEKKPMIFVRSLEQALKANRRIYISSYTKSEHERFLSERFNNIKYTNHSRIIIQPPSLRIEEGINKVLAVGGSIDDVNINRLIKIKEFTFGGDEFDKKTLISNKYILFNSSIEPRKNLEMALDSFCNYLSSEKKSSFKFCVIGKLRSDNYSIRLKKRFSNKNIIYTDYVNEKTKLLLYLNARAFICTSLVEGFGIPVLDAAAMGIKSLVSDIKPHQEIYNLKDFNKYINLLSLTNYNSWVNKLENIFKNDELYSLSNEDKYKRLKRYYFINEQIKNEFNLNIQKLIRK